MDFEKDLSAAAIIIHGKQYHVSKGVRSIKFRKWFRWRREKSDLARIERETHEDRDDRQCESPRFWRHNSPAVDE